MQSLSSEAVETNFNKLSNSSQPNPASAISVSGSSAISLHASSISNASKIVPKQAGQPGFQTAGDFNDFKQSLFEHCHQSAKVVHDFCGQWYSKTEWERGIDLNNTTGLVSHAIDKMRDELKMQREDVA
jgi:hypothetical protein